METANNFGAFDYSITHWFQPIYNLKNNSIVGYEALLRDSTDLGRSPVELFDEAKKNGRQSILDLLSIKTASEEFGNKQGLLFLNIFPSTLLEENFLSWWDNNIPPKTNIVLEILENEPANSWRDIKKVIKKLKSRNAKIAIDDMGSGYSFFQQWIEYEPDFIKLDRYYAKELSVSNLKQKTLRSMVYLFSGTTEIIIEGVETEDDLRIAQHIGINYAQGYLLGRPLPMVR